MMNLETDFREAMARFAGVVTLITTGRGDACRGLTATAVCSLSSAPPSVLVCVNGTASAHDAILVEGCFGVNLLSPDQAILAERFSGRDGHQGAARFAGSRWIELATGAPILAEAPVALDCRVSERFDGFSHSIIVGRVEAVQLLDGAAAECLLWHRRAFRRTVDLATP